MTETTPKALTSEQAHALACVLDTLIPPSEDGSLPGAGEVGMVSAIEEAMAAEASLEPAVRLGLSAFEGLVSAIGLDAFAALPLAERSEMLNSLGESQPAFVAGLIFPLYSAYYQQPRVLVALGMEGRPPHPKGYEMEPANTSLLDAVRKRKPMYREC
jgi:hypothetical protein